MIEEKSVHIKGKQYRLVSNFREDDTLREAFYGMPKDYFGADFKTWYEKGYWGEQYNPHCLLDGNQVVSTVGVYSQSYELRGKEKKIIQLGSVATLDSYRKQGLSHYLIEYIMSKYQSTCDAICLFGNDSVVEFYPKFGFKKTNEYRYFKWVDQSTQSYTIRKLDASNIKDLEWVKQKVNHHNSHQQLAVKENAPLVMFYWEICQAVELFYIEELEVVAVASYKKDRLEVSDFYGEATIEKVIEALVKQDHTKVILGFTPICTEGYQVEEFRKDDCTFFVNRESFKEVIENQFLRIPVIAHT